MLGAIIGDTIGSVYEFNNIKTTDFPLFSSRSNFTDDSVLTIAVAHWLTKDAAHSQQSLEESLISFANEHSCPMGGYGGGFKRWLSNPDRHPYNSWGNGSAMRVSSVGWYFNNLQEVEYWAGESARITHNHPEGIKGAQATAAAIFLARTGRSKDDIQRYIETNFGYDLHLTCDQIRPQYTFNESCQGTVPEALVAFLESSDFEDCIRLGVSLGGDSDTLCAIAGSIAEAYYQTIPDTIAVRVWNLLPTPMQKVLLRFAASTPYSLPKTLFME